MATHTDTDKSSEKGKDADKSSEKGKDGKDGEKGKDAKTDDKQIPIGLPITDIRLFIFPSQIPLTEKEYHEKAAKIGKNNTCMHCKKEYVPEYCNFHDLCNACFDEFNDQKMNGRHTLLGWRKPSNDKYYESAIEWSKSKAISTTIASTASKPIMTNS